jgi:hypothetical protein
MGEIVEAFFDFFIRLNTVITINIGDCSILFRMTCDSFCVDRSLPRQLLFQLHRITNHRDAFGRMTGIWLWISREYSNPDAYPGIGGAALAAFVKGVWTAFPDFSVELLKAGEIEPGLIAEHWRASGTNTGPGAWQRTHRDVRSSFRKLRLFGLKEKRFSQIKRILTERG